MCPQLSCTLVSWDPEASSLSAQRDELKIQQTRHGRLQGRHRLGGVALVIATVVPAVAPGELARSQVCFPDRWKPSSEIQRHHKRQSLCSPLDMIWKYSEEICTTCSFQCWNKNPFATFLTPALWGLAGVLGSKGQAWGRGMGAAAAWCTAPTGPASSLLLGPAQLDSRSWLGNTIDSYPTPR